MSHSLFQESVSLWILVAGLALSGCGYRPLHAGVRGGLVGRPRIHVANTAVVRVPSGAITTIDNEIILGARSELALWGALAEADGDSTDRLTLEVVRLDERGEGFATASTGRASSRAVCVRVTARGTLRQQNQTFETPDIDATEDLATVDNNESAWEGARTNAIRAAARKAGAAVARQVLGIP